MRPCPRTIDRPLLVLGLEGEDIAVLLLVCGIPAILFAPTLPLLVLLVGWPALAWFKRGKTPGHIVHWLYERGVPFQGFMPPGRRRYSMFVRKEPGER